MPGANCSIFGCNSNRKNCSLTIFKVPSGNNDFDSQWRKELINVVTKDRVIDESLRKQIENRTIRICEKHFNPSQLNYREFLLAHIFFLSINFLISILTCAHVPGSRFCF